MPSHAFTNRLHSFQQTIPPSELWLLANPTDIQYVTGFVSLVPAEREALLLISKHQAHLLYTAFSPVHKLADITYHEGVHPDKLKKQVAALLQNNTFRQVMIDEQQLFVSELRALEAAVKNSASSTNRSETNRSDINESGTNQKNSIQALPGHQLGQQRMVKDSSEIELLKQAGQCAQQAWTQLEPWIKPGVTEHGIKQKLEQLLLEFGSQRPAFPTIVAFGANSALPHHQPTTEVLRNNTAVLIDFGATIDEYRSDMTRTIWVGDAVDPTFTTIATTVQQAYQDTITFLNTELANQKTIRALEVDTIAREVIKKAGYGETFIHTTGHGVGLDIHEQPSLSWSNTTEIKPGFAITVEPGIYLTSIFGYRYENTLIVMDNRIEEITV